MFSWMLIINKFLNTPGQRKEFMCPFCKKVTPHVSISYAEYFDRGTGWDIFGRVNDFNPVTVLTSGNPYMCTKCGNKRVEGGLFSDLKNKKMELNGEQTGDLGNGIKCTGMWINGRPIGKCLIEFPDGSKQNIEIVNYDEKGDPILKD